MSEVARSTIKWLSIYVFLTLLPLGIALANPPAEARGFWVEAGALLGLLGLGVLAMQLVISGRHRWFAPEVGLDNTLQFHRRIGTFALLLVLAHPVTLMLADPGFLAYLDPRDETLRAVSLSALVAATAVLVVSSLWRVSVGLSYEWWRALHGALSLFIVAGGLGHALMVDHYTSGLLTKALLVAVILVPLLLLLDSRLFRLLRMRRRPWRVAAVEPERGDSTTLVLEADGHRGMPFLPGQFFWVTLGETPFSLQQHPFSFASSASSSERFAFTSKALGDFSRRLPEVEPGTRAWVEGPYGAFVPRPAESDALVLLAGGVGITPIMSMLRTYRQQGISTPLYLVYANDVWEDVLFREELDDMAGELPLTLVHVLSDPPSAWNGERGYVDTGLLRRQLPVDGQGVSYFICGPEPMMNAAEQALISLGVAPARIYSDRFDLV
ncbi:MAG: ferric reductase-like transmembrane domain-containing protein [Ectothiorhodospiraceae bacterium]|nr:ferric reductase-like transmembrane domain-containing protein [Ectothiorhodospiraceae bacterium]